MFVPRFMSNGIIFLVLTYVVICEDLIECPDGEQGIEQTEPIICEPSQKATETVVCSFVFATQSEQDQYEPINCLKLINMGNDSVAGFPEIALGGVNFTYVYGDVTSQVGQGVNYTLNVWSLIKTTTTLPPTTTIQTTIETTFSETTVPDTTIPETTTPESTTASVETTTSGNVKVLANQVLLIAIFGFNIVGTLF